MRLPGWFCRGKQCSVIQRHIQFRVKRDGNTCCMGCLSLAFAMPDSKQDRHLLWGSTILNRASCIKLVGWERWAGAGSTASEPAAQPGDGWGAVVPMLWWERQQGRANLPPLQHKGCEPGEHWGCTATQFQAGGWSQIHCRMPENPQGL